MLEICLSPSNLIFEASRMGSFDILVWEELKAEQVLSVKDDYVGVTTIDAQATRTGAGPEGPGTRPKAKPGSEVVRAGCTDLESICEPDGDPDALNLSNCGIVGSIFQNFDSIFWLGTLCLNFLVDH